MTKVRSSKAWDLIVNPAIVADTCVSTELAYGVACVDGQWFKVSVQAISQEDAVAFFPECAQSAPEDEDEEEMYDYTTYNNGSGSHAYDVYVNHPKGTYSKRFLVIANNRTQAFRRVERDGHEVTSVNMVG